VAHPQSSRSIVDLSRAAPPNALMQPSLRLHASAAAETRTTWTAICVSRSLIPVSARSIQCSSAFDIAIARAAPAAAPYCGPPSCASLTTCCCSNIKAGHCCRAGSIAMHGQEAQQRFMLRHRLAEQRGFRGRTNACSPTIQDPPHTTPSQVVTAAGNLFRSSSYLVWIGQRRVALPANTHE
jgi:hypothetical protein